MTQETKEQRDQQVHRVQIVSFLVPQELRAQLVPRAIKVLQVRQEPQEYVEPQVLQEAKEQQGLRVLRVLQVQQEQREFREPREQQVLQDHRGQ